MTASAASSPTSLVPVEGVRASALIPVAPLVDPASLPGFSRLNWRPDAHFVQPLLPEPAPAPALALAAAPVAPREIFVNAGRGWGDPQEAEREQMLREMGRAQRQQARRAERRSGLMAAAGAALILAAIAFLLAVLVITIPKQPPPEIVAVAGVLDASQVEQKRIVEQRPMVSAPSPAAASPDVILSAAPSALALPSFDGEPTVGDFGGDWGADVSMASFAAASGLPKVQFYGQKSDGRRVVFALDFSNSMLGGGRRELLIRELGKSLRGLPESADYQIIPFFRYAAAHDFLQGEMPHDEEEALALIEKHVAAGGGIAWVPAQKARIKDSLARMRRYPSRTGNNWAAAFELVLQLKPRPDLVYFLSDGKASDRQYSKTFAMLQQAGTAGEMTIQAIALGETPEGSLEYRMMQKLATDNGGDLRVFVD